METFLKKKAEIDDRVRKVLGELQEEIERDLKSYDVAEWYYKADDFDSALNYINKYLSVDPDNAAAQELMGKIIESLIFTETVPSTSLRNFELYDEADERSEDYSIHLDESKCYEVWQSCLADINQARSSLNSSLHRLTTPALQGHHSKLIKRLFDVNQQLLDTEIALYNQDVRSEDNSFELFSEEPPINREDQETRRENTALQQMVTRQNELLENLNRQATANENLLKSALDEIGYLREEVRRLKTSAVVKTEPW